MEKYKYNLITGGGGGPQIQPLIWVQSNRELAQLTLSLPLNAVVQSSRAISLRTLNSKIVTEGLGKKTKTQSATKL